MSGMNTVSADLRFTLGDRMRKSMQVAGITSAGMSDRMHVAPQTVARWIRDASRPTMGNIIAWSTITGVPVDWLLKDEDDQADVA